jgi:hypothetical protein
MGGGRALLKPFWAMFHVVDALARQLLWLGAQPAWIEHGSPGLAARLHTLNLGGALAVAGRHAVGVAAVRAALFCIDAGRAR